MIHILVIAAAVVLGLIFAVCFVLALAGPPQ